MRRWQIWKLGKGSTRPGAFWISVESRPRQSGSLLTLRNHTTGLLAPEWIFSDFIRSGFEIRLSIHSLSQAYPARLKFLIIRHFHFEFLSRCQTELS